MRVDHRRGDVGVAEEFLDGADVVAGFEQVGGEAVAQRVAGGGFGELGAQAGVADGLLDDRLVEVVAAFLAGFGILAPRRSCNAYPAFFNPGIPLFILTEDDL